MVWRTWLEAPMDDHVEQTTPLPSPSVNERAAVGGETDDGELGSTSSDQFQDSPHFGGSVVPSDFIGGPV